MAASCDFARVPEEEFEHSLIMIIILRASVCTYPPHNSGITHDDNQNLYNDSSSCCLPRSSCSICFLNTSALKDLKAFSILSFVSGSDVIDLFAVAPPSNKPSSPPIRMPPDAKNVYVKKSPNVEGFNSGVISGIASSLPFAKRICVGFSEARKAWNIFCLFDRTLKAK